MARMPSINASLDQLQGESARGAASGGPTQGNVMPGPSALAGSPGRAPSGGGTAGLGANPSRMGNPVPASGAYQQIQGSPGPSAPPTARGHALTLASLTHLKNAGFGHPQHGMIESHARAGIQKFKTAQAPKARAFGSLGAAMNPMGGGGMSPAGSAVPGANMGGGQPPSVQMIGRQVPDDGI